MNMPLLVFTHRCPCHLCSCLWLAGSSSLCSLASPLTDIGI